MLALFFSLERGSFGSLGMKHLSLERGSLDEPGFAPGSPPCEGGILLLYYSPLLLTARIPCRDTMLVGFFS